MDPHAIRASSSPTSLEKSNRPSRRLKFVWIALLSALVLAAAVNFLQYEVRSYVFLLQFLDPRADGFLVRLEGHGFDVQDVAFNTAQGPVRAKLYVPQGLRIRPAWFWCMEFITSELTSRGS